MKNTFKIFLGCAVLASALTAGTVRSQGTAGAAQLLIPVGTETVALSGTNPHPSPISPQQYQRIACKR